MGELRQLVTIGPVLEQQLEQVGITTAGELRDLGSREAWLRILGIDTSACYNRLCGLEGAVRGVRYKFLNQSVKDELKAFYRAHKGA